MTLSPIPATSHFLNKALTTACSVNLLCLSVSALMVFFCPFFSLAAEQLNGIGGSVTVPPMLVPPPPEKQPCLASPAAPPLSHPAPCPETNQSSKNGATKMGERSIAAAAPATPGAAPSSNGSIKPDEEKAKKLLYCALCKVAVNSLSQLEAHNKGMMGQLFTRGLGRGENTGGQLIGFVEGCSLGQTIPYHATASNNPLSLTNCPQKEGLSSRKTAVAEGEVGCFSQLVLTFNSTLLIV